MRVEQDFDSRVKAALENECDGISVSETLKGRIDAAVCEQQIVQEQKTTGKHFGVKKFCIAAAAACLFVSGISVFAGNVDFFVNVSKMAPDYADYRDMKKVQAKLGYKMDSVERFANGYEFASASIDSQLAYSDENGVMYSVPTADVSYRKDGKLIDLTVGAAETAAASASDTRPKEPKAVRMCGDITLRYDEVINKIVPQGYELTEEDMINEQRDDFNIVYMTVSEKENGTEKEQAASDKEKRDHDYVGVTGTTDSSVSVTLKQSGESWMEWKEGGEPYTSQVKTVSWDKDGKHYELSGVDLEMSADELFDMVQELIGAGSD